MKIDSIEPMLNHVVTAGQMAVKLQNDINHSERRYKGDGSVVTKTDEIIENFLFEKVSSLYPEGNIITEEKKHAFDEIKNYTFVIDPIDGTDAFSQGMSGWSISLGLLDKHLNPIAGIVYSPQLKLLFFADIGKKSTLNSNGITVQKSPELITAQSNIMVPSRVHKLVDLRKFSGKIRSIGSAALHLCFPIIYPSVFAAIETSQARIWDIAGAHAINLSVGFNFEYLGGGKINYSKLVNGDLAENVILSGAANHINKLRKVLA